jgi:putative chitinase
MKTQAEWVRILQQCQVKAATAARWAPVFAAEVKPGTFSAGIGELDDFLGQVLHESGMLERIEENLNYGAARMCQVWPTRFPTAASAASFVGNPVALANKVYGGRLGNTQPGDGWRFRGRGLVQVTGRDNYATVGKALGLDLAGNPDMLAQPAIALRASIAWWERKIPDSAMGDVRRITKLVNGGKHGLDDRGRLAALAAKALAA